MVKGRMIIGFAGNENVEILNIRREECLSTVEMLKGGGKLSFMGDDMWVNPTQVTYIKFKKN